MPITESSVQRSRRRVKGPAFGGTSVSAAALVVGVNPINVPLAPQVADVRFIAIFPLTFIANTFVSVESLPEPLRTIAE